MLVRHQNTQEMRVSLFIKENKMPRPHNKRSFSDWLKYADKKAKEKDFIHITIPNHCASETTVTIFDKMVEEKKNNL